MKYLAKPERLTPPKQFYVVWVQSEAGDVKNIGQLMSDSNNNGSITGTTSTKPVQIFVTAEDAGDANWPSSQELFRIQNINLK